MKKTELEKENERLNVLRNCLLSGKIVFMDMPIHCEMPHCFNLPKVSMQNLFTQNRPIYICPTCAKVAEQMAKDEVNVTLKWENCHEMR